MKKLFCALLAAALLLYPAAFAAAEASPAFQVSSAAGKPGDTVSLTVSTVNNPGLASLELDVDYDASILDWTGVSPSEIGGLWDAAAGESLLWVDADNYSGNGALLTLTFQIKTDAPVGETSVGVSYDADNVFDENGQNVYFEALPGTVKVYVFQRGDVNGDGQVNADDALQIMRYVNRLSSVFDSGTEQERTDRFLAADVDGDGSVTEADAAEIQRYVIGLRGAF